MGRTLVLHSAMPSYLGHMCIVDCGGKPGEFAIGSCRMMEVEGHDEQSCAGWRPCGSLAAAVSVMVEICY